MSCFLENDHANLLIVMTQCHIQLKQLHPRFIEWITSTWFLSRAEAPSTALDRRLQSEIYSLVLCQ